MPITLDEQATKDLAQLALGMSHDKELRPLVNKYLKKTSGKVLPDIEIDEIRADLKKEREQEKLEREIEKTKIRQEAQREALKSRYDDAAITEIEKWMEKHGVADYEAAAQVYAANMKASEPSHDISNNTWELPKIEKKDFGNLIQRRRSALNSAIGDIMKQRKAS